MASSSSFRKYQVFISHAGEDKRTIAIPLRDMLLKQGITAFVDENNIPPCGTAIEEMTAAMDNANVAVVVLSPEFVAKKWPMKELLFFLERRENAQAKTQVPPMILPVFYRLTVADVYTEPCFERKGADGKSLYRATRFFERSDNGEPEPDVKIIRGALCTLHGIQGVENKNRASNEMESVPSRLLLLKDVCDSILKARALRFGERTQPSVKANGSSSPGDANQFRPYTHTELLHDVVFDFASIGKYGEPLTHEGRIRRGVLNYENDSDHVFAIVGGGGVGKSDILKDEAVETGKEALDGVAKETGVELDALEEECDQVSKARDEASETIKARDADLEKVNASILVLTKEKDDAIADRETKVKEMEHRLAVAVADSETLSKELEDVKKQREAALADEATLSKDLDELKSAKEQLEDMVSASEKEVAEAKEMIAQVSKEKDDVKADLDSKSTEVEELNARFIALGSERDGLIKMKDDLEATVEQSQHEADDAKAALEEQKLAFVNLESERNLLQSEKSMVEKEFFEVRDRFTALDKEKAALEMRVMQLEESESVKKIRKAEAEVAAVLFENKLLEKRNAALVAQLSGAQENVSALSLKDARLNDVEHPLSQKNSAVIAALATLLLQRKKPSEIIEESKRHFQLIIDQSDQGVGRKLSVEKRKDGEESVRKLRCIVDDMRARETETERNLGYLKAMIDADEESRKLRFGFMALQEEKVTHYPQPKEVHDKAIKTNEEIAQVHDKVKTTEEIAHQYDTTFCTALPSVPTKRSQKRSSYPVKPLTNLRDPTA